MLQIPPFDSIFVSRYSKKSWSRFFFGRESSDIYYRSMLRAKRFLNSSTTRRSYTAFTFALWKLIFQERNNRIRYTKLGPSHNPQSHLNDRFFFFSIAPIISRDKVDLNSAKVYFSIFYLKKIFEKKTENRKRKASKFFKADIIYLSAVFQRFVWKKMSLYSSTRPKRNITLFFSRRILLGSGICALCSWVPTMCCTPLGTPSSAMCLGTGESSLFSTTKQREHRRELVVKSGFCGAYPQIRMRSERGTRTEEQFASHHRCTRLCGVCVRLSCKCDRSWRFSW